MKLNVFVLRMITLVENIVDTVDGRTQAQSSI